MPGLVVMGAKSADAPYRVGFLLVPEYSQLAFASALETLRMANQVAGRTLYDWFVLTVDGEPVAASNGLRLADPLATATAPALDLVLVCGGVEIQEHADTATLRWIRALARQGTALGALCTGTYLLALAGVLDDRRCTLHWKNISSVNESMRFPRTIFSQELFVIDRDRYTSSGGIAPLDMMLHLVVRQHGLELAETIAEEFLHERIREVNERQRMPLHVRLGTSQPKLVEVATLMEANIHEPLSPDELASHAGISRRQLERLFQRYLRCTPSRYYLDLRLNRARQLLLQTEMPVTDIAIACGFVSPPHFTKCYHDRYDHAPKDERRQHRARLREQQSVEGDPDAPTPPASNDTGG
ncbi:MAG: GlxA family transcriptional regulator [Gammaproteobacteria bacterium]|nr:GlxA family transcriptional regulator [Gammaproteobacteria bacterium]